MRASKNITEKILKKSTPDSTRNMVSTSRSKIYSVPTSENNPTGRVPAVTVILGAVASIGGFIFGMYNDTGLHMKYVDF
jgi:SP family sugar:H+ symporter-like MFS transporter